MYSLSCPACGHHIANLSTIPGAPAEEKIERGDEVDRQVSNWLSGIEPGRYRAAELRPLFANATGLDVNAKEFGLALQLAGALPSRGTNGVRTWTVLPGR